MKNLERVKLLSFISSFAHNCEDDTVNLLLAIGQLMSFTPEELKDVCKHIDDIYRYKDRS